LEISAIAGTLLINAAGTLERSSVERLRDHIRASDRPVVLDLSGVETVEPEALDMLRNQWRALGDRLRVVAPHSSAAADALKRAGLRRFAVHASLSGALAQAAE